MKVAIVGSGVSGGLIAYALQAIDGVEVTCFERVSIDAHAQAGNGLNIGPNALKAMDAVMPEKAKALRTVSLPWERWRCCLASGEELFHIPLDTVADNAGVRVRWSELYKCVRSNLTEATQYETQVVSIDVADIEQGPVLTYQHKQDSERFEAQFDLVIVAEGRYSELREQLCGAPQIRHLGVANFRCLIEDGGASGVEDMEQWFCGSQRILAFRVADGRVYISGNLPLNPGALIPIEMKRKAFLRDAYTPRSGPIDPAYHYLIEAAFAESSVHHWARAQEINDIYQAVSGQVIFVGDAAHAMAPTLGQGATSAVEDACVFVDNFRQAWPDAWDTASFADRFEQFRRERIAFIKSFSWEASDVLCEGGDPIAGNRAKASAASLAKFRRLYQEL